MYHTISRELVTVEGIYNNVIAEGICQASAN